MFNKGMLYQHYSDELYRILDVQRAGMIPQLVKHYIEGFIDTSAKGMKLNALYNALSHSTIWSELDGFVDWYKVEEFGVKKYKTFQQKQEAEFGMSPEKQALAEAEKKKYYVSDTEYAMKVEPKRAA